MSSKKKKKFVKVKTSRGRLKKKSGRASVFKKPAKPSEKFRKKFSRTVSSREDRKFEKEESGSLEKEKQAPDIDEISEEMAGERRSRRRERSLEAESDDQTLDRTSMRIYLDQIEHIPLLTPEEEIELAQKVQSGSRGAQVARQKMIRCNLRLVIALAKRYSNMGLPFSDLVEEGNIGLMRAVEKFNPDRGYRFSTYASWWIKQGIMRSLSNHGKTIRIPVYMYDIIAKWRKVRDKLTQKYSRAPTRKEIAQVMQVSIHKIKEIENIANRPSSLNAPLSLDGSAELADVIPDDESQSPEVRLDEMLKSQRIESLLSNLDDREKSILIYRFGLKEEEVHTLEEVAQKFDITRERVRQIEAIALSKVRAMFVEHREERSDYLE